MRVLLLMSLLAVLAGPADAQSGMLERLLEDQRLELFKERQKLRQEREILRRQREAVAAGRQRAEEERAELERRRVAREERQRARDRRARDGGGRSMMCSVFVPDQWRDTFAVPLTWRPRDCRRYAEAIGATEFQLACSFALGRDKFSFAAPGGALPQPNCGWRDVPRTGGRMRPPFRPDRYR